MFEIHGTIQPYAWGSTDAIPAILGTDETGEPQAEYWLGAHDRAPSTLDDGSNLAEQIAAHPEELGTQSRAEFGDRLPFLLKLLSAAQPLSLQAHPSREQAVAGFAAENEAGIPLDAPNRTYKDDWPKPEILVALTEFDALCGFREPAVTWQLFHDLGLPPEIETVIGPLTQRAGSAGLAEVFLDVLSLDADRMYLVNEVVSAALRHADDEGDLGRFARTAVELDEVYPGQPSIIAALLLNRVRLQPGEAIFLPAGNMHAYLKGTGVELMANSDNVLRGGLTTKHIDVDGLVQVVDFHPLADPVIRATEEMPGVYRYATPAPEFALWRLDLDASRSTVLPAPDRARIVLVTDGHLVAGSEDETVELVQGHAMFVPAGQMVQADGNCTAFVAASGV